MGFTPIAFNTLRTNAQALLDAALTEGVYFEPPDAIDFARVVLGSIEVQEEDQLALNNTPQTLLSIPLICTTSVAGQTKDEARQELYTLLGKVQDVIREYPDFNNYPGCMLTGVGDFTIDDDGPVLWSITMNWDIALIIQKT